MYTSLINRLKYRTCTAFSTTFRDGGFRRLDHKRAAAVDGRSSRKSDSSESLKEVRELTGLLRHEYGKFTTHRMYLTCAALQTHNLTQENQELMQKSNK